MISLDMMIDVVTTSRTDYEKMHIEWESKVRELYHRFECTPLDTIFNNPNVRSVFRELIKVVCDIEYELMHDDIKESCGGAFSTLLGFDCECDSCQYGPVILEHMETLKKEDEEWVRDHNKCENGITKIVL